MRTVDAAGAAQLLSKAAEVLLLCHVSPDADTVGSALALGGALLELGIRARVSVGDPAGIAEEFRTFDVHGLIVDAASITDVPNFVVTCDAASQDRVGSLSPLVDSAQCALVIDHHASNSGFGTHLLVDAQAEATTVVMLEVIDALGVELTEPIARALYAGLVSDTGGFRRARAVTHQQAARLLASGVDPEDVTRVLFDARPRQWLAMLAAALERASFVDDAVGGAGLVYTVVRTRDLAGMAESEMESVVNVLRAVREIAVAAVFKQRTQTRWTVSLRSYGDVDVSAIALSMGGGGHRNAAGFSIEGDEAEVVDRVLARLSR